eukprot:COSAG01_NODE_9528_length_2418_cov_2.092281_2_plen_418_part_00
MEKHQKRKRHVCRTCGASVFNLAPHTKTCKGTLLKNKASQLAGLKKGTAKATRSTRARSRVTTLPRLWRVDDAGALATLSATQLKTQPLSVRGWADPPVITTTPPATSQVAALETLQRLIPIGQRPVVKVYTSLPGKYEVESPDWTDLPGTKRVNIHAPDFVLPLHAYGYVMVDDCETGRACAEECALVPDVLRKDLLPSKYAVVFSTGGVVLTSHHDSCGGLLVLAEGSSAIGQIIFGEQYAHERGVDVFGATREDEEGCHWRDVAELLLPGDLVTIPHKHPHAMRCALYNRNGTTEAQQANVLVGIPPTPRTHGQRPPPAMAAQPSPSSGIKALCPSSTAVCRQASERSARRCEKLLLLLPLLAAGRLGALSQRQLMPTWMRCLVFAPSAHQGQRRRSGAMTAIATSAMNGTSCS